MDNQYTYRVYYRSDDDTKETIEDRSDTGLITVTTDHEVKTQDDLKEIARTIGLENGYTAVEILQILQEIGSGDVEGVEDDS